MGTRGFEAYRYKNRYYRLYTHSGSNPSYGGAEFASIIPRNVATREAWIKHIINGLESGEAQRRRLNIKDHTEYEIHPMPGDAPDSVAFDTSEPIFSDICDDCEWITGDVLTEWTYVIDLDYRAFTVNGRVHFNLDNMPRDPGFEHYFNDDRTLRNLPPIPEEHLATVSYWPALDCDPSTILNEYNLLQPRTLSLEDWGAPTWNSLSPAQHLSVKLVKTIVSDYKQVLAGPDLPTEHHKILLICWQVACAAATSHVLCPTQTPSSLKTTLYMTVAHGHFDYVDERFKEAVLYRMSAEVFSRVYCWFRGCLIKFSLRLDEDTLLRQEVNSMVKQLRENGRSGGIGIAMSSNQVVAVVVGDAGICQSPLLNFHDVKGDVGDGLLLLLHLLSPATTVNKTPWVNVPAPCCSTSPILPEDVIRHILRFTDFDSYHFTLPLVSRLIRSVCIARPRFGDLFLAAINSDGTYQVLSSSGPTTEMRVELVRTGHILDPALLCTFQHCQAGASKVETDLESIISKLGKKRSKWEPPRMMWNTMVGEELLPMRVQVVEGTWSMVRVDKGAGMGV